MNRRADDHEAESVAAGTADDSAARQACDRTRRDGDADGNSFPAADRSAFTPTVWPAQQAANSASNRSAHAPAQQATHEQAKSPPYATADAAADSPAHWTAQ